MCPFFFLNFFSTFLVPNTGRDLQKPEDKAVPVPESQTEYKAWG